MPTPFDYRRGLDQGRVQPETRVVSPDDTPGPAVLTSLALEPFELEDQDTLLIAVNGGLTQQIIFEAADFADIGAATAAEVGAAIAAQLSGVVASENAGAVVLTTNLVGLSAGFRVTGGTGQNTVQFPTGLVSGTQGEWSFVLGHELPGQVFPFTTGDGVSIEQSADLNDVLLWRMRGAVRWRPEGNPAGASWQIRWSIGGVDGTTMVDVDQIDPTLPALISLDDVVVNVSGLAAVPQAATITLETVATGAAGDFEQELPAVFVDFIEFDETPNPLEVGNRFPTPDMAGVTPLAMAAVEFDVLNTTANPLVLADTRIVIDGTHLVYDAGAFVGAFSGSVTPATGPAGRDTHFVLDLSSLAPFDSEQSISIEIETATSADSTIVAWGFTMEDTTAPQVVAAQARNKKTVRVSFSEPVLMDASAGGALYVGNYEIDPRSSPAVTVIPQSVEMVTASSVDVTVDLELSFGASYLVTVTNVEDLAGNPLDSLNTALFTAFRPAQPAGRSFQLWDRIPAYDRRRDEAIPSRPLRKFILIFQDVFDLLLSEVDRWTDIIDIDLAPEPFLNAILRDLGNPFDFVELSVIEKRRLARILIDIYKQKGTEVGIINTVRFFLGIDIELDKLNYRDYWKIGVHQLSLDTVIGPGPGSPLWYSFYIVSPIILTDDQRDKILKIATYMKPAHEHILGIREPGGVVTPSNYWNLGVDLLGTTTVIGA